MTSLSTLLRTGILGVILCSGFPVLAQVADGGLPSTVTDILIGSTSASPQKQVEALTAEQQMLAQTAKSAAAGDIKKAWKAMTADLAKGNGKGSDGISADRLGWRVMTVVGFLKNQSEGEIADVFARYALGQPWCQQAPSDEVRYWCAMLAVEGIGDRKTAKAWLGSAKSGEATKAKELREKLDSAEKAFPSHG